MEERGRAVPAAEELVKDVGGDEAASTCKKDARHDNTISGG